MTDDAAVALTVLVVLIVFLVIFYRSIQIVQPYQLGVLIVFGSYRRLLHPGINFVPPLGRVVRVDLRMRTVPIPRFSISVGARTVDVAGTASFRVVDAARSIFQTRNLDLEVATRTRADLIASVGHSGEPLLSGSRILVSDNDLGGANAAVEPFGVKLATVNLEIVSPPM